ARRSIRTAPCTTRSGRPSRRSISRRPGGVAVAVWVMGCPAPRTIVSSRGEPPSGAAGRGGPPSRREGAMQQRPFGRTGLTVPAAGMGTWQTFDVRGERAERARREVVDAALQAGTNLFDTSRMYGESQRVLARALEGRRGQALVADKVWTESRAEARERVRRALEWYGTVDVYQIHNLVAWRDHLPLLEDLHGRGLARVLGATHYRHAAFPELM